MKAPVFLAVVFAASLAVMVAGRAQAGEYVFAPKALGEVINPNFRIALGNHAPGYDDLSRADQVRAFVQVYKSLNNGEDPFLSASDSRYIAGVGAYPSPFPVPPAEYINRRSGDLYTYVDGFGYRRTPGVRSPYSWFRGYNGTGGRYYRPLSPYGVVPRPQTPPVPADSLPRVGTGTRPPPGGYGPPVATPRHAPVPRAPSVHAGP